MIQSKRTYNNGFFEVQEIYSDKGMKILDKRNGYAYDNYEDNPITIVKSRYDDYFETTEPVKEREEENTEGTNDKEDTSEIDGEET